MNGKLAALAALIAVAGCQAPAADVTSVSAPIVVSSYGEKLPGKYLVHVNGSAFDKVIAPQSANCSAYRIPLKASGAFSDAVSKAVAQVVEQHAMTTTTPTSADIKASGSKGAIVVTADTVDVQFRMIESTGLFNGLEVEVSASAASTLDSANGRLHGTRVESTNSSSGQAGPICDEGDARMREAATKTIRSLASKIAESIANSQRVRDGV